MPSNSIILTTMCEQNKQTEQVKMSKIWQQQSTFCYNLNHFENKQICQTKHIIINERQEYQHY